MISLKPKQDKLSDDENSVKALQGFLVREHTPELDTFKESLGEGVGILVEIMDERDGIPSYIFAQGEDSAHLKKKDTLLDDEKRRVAKEFQEWLERFAALASKIFEPLKRSISGRIDSIMVNAQKEIDALDTVLSTVPAKGSKGKGHDIGKAFKDRRNRLKDFVKRLSKHGENVETANNTADLLEVEAELEEDVVAFDNSTLKKRVYNRVSDFIVSFYGTKAAIEPVAPEVEMKDPYEYDILEELDIDMNVSTTDEDDDTESGSSELDEEEELAL